MSGQPSLVAARAAARLDAFLAGELTPRYSRAQIARAIKAGLVVVNHRPARASAAVRAGDVIELLEAPAAPVVASHAPAVGPIEILYADDEMIFVNKPPGMVVHHSAGHRDSTLVDALLERFPELAQVRELDGSTRAGIVHRLDMDTSGVMVVARTSSARAALSAQFARREVSKLYLALCRGHLARASLRLEMPIGRHPVDRKRMAVRARVMRPALSEVRVLALRELASEGERIPLSVVAVRPRTGRTHQIRVHLSAIGHPCLGDPIYGGRKTQVAGLARQALHAMELSVAKPTGGAIVTVAAGLPADLVALLTASGMSAEERAQLEVLARRF
jgi:23S rRNA pseudouridine1911/1915/1917 synthase